MDQKESYPVFEEQGEALMDLISFCRQQGILLEAMPTIGVWTRHPTVDHPKKRNGAVKFLGDFAFVQNHATQTSVSVWRRTGVLTESERRMIDVTLRGAKDRMIKGQERAALRAAAMFKHAHPSTHPYLEKKGFPKVTGFVIELDDQPTLCVPMFVGNRMVGCQMIKPDGQKRFLSGQRTSGAEFRFDKRGMHILVEGYATGLAVREAMTALRLPYTIHVTFSAGNMKTIAAGLPDGLVIADNDASGTGERVAKEIGWRFWMSDVVGEDANDAWRRQGTFKLSQAISALLRTERLAGRSRSGHQGLGVTAA